MTATQPLRRRGAPFESQGPDGYHVGWYAITPSSDVARGQVIGLDLFSGRVIVYRGEDGGVRVMGAYCRHLGADLATGDVVGNDIRCPLHNWQYGPDGACTVIPAGDRIPSEARLYQFPSVEKFGLVWVFNGDDPTEFPYFQGYDSDALTAKVGDRADYFPIEPWAIFTNAIDIQHLRVVHQMTVDCDLDAIDVSDHRISYDLVVDDPNLGAMRQHMNVFGTSTVLMSADMGGVEMLVGATAAPKPDGGCLHRPFAAAIRDESSPETMQAIDARLSMMLDFAYALLQDDLPIMTNLHCREDLLLPADRALARYFRYVRNIPRANPARDFLC